MLVPRDYQSYAVDATFDWFYKNPVGNPVIGMPTGTGKSVVIAMLLMRIYSQWPNQKVMILTHVKELIDQNFQKLLHAWPTAPAGIYSSGLGRRDTQQKIIFAGIGSVAKRSQAFGHVDLVIIDECHLVSPSSDTMYQKFLQRLRERNPYLRVIGTTATAWRLGYGKITEGDTSLFHDFCCDMTGMEPFNWFLEQGYLVPLIPKTTNTKIDTEGMHIRAGEFVAAELEAAVGDALTYEALKETLEHGQDRKSWLIFCAGKDRAIATANMLTEMGIKCESVTDKTPDKERDRIIKDFKSGRLRAVTNNNVLTTGFDHPGLDLIVVLRPTASAGLWVQMLGRGTRPEYVLGFDLSTQDGRLASIAASSKHNCLVLDFAGNTRRLGPINDPVVPRRKGEAAGEAPVKLCPMCATYNHASARHCILCGAEFPQYGPKLEQTASTDQLIKFIEPEIKVFAVDHMTYTEHQKAGKPKSLRLTYYIGLRQFPEFVLIEYEDNLSRSRYAKFWRERAPADLPQPSTVRQALDVVNLLKAPTHIRVWVNKKPYPEIMGYCFDGTAFGEQEPSGVAPTAQVTQQKKQALTFDEMDDDIPF